MALVTVSSIFSSVRRIREPAVEPVSLFEAKAHLRLMDDFADDDAYIMGLISAGRRMLEARTRRTFMLTRWQAKFSRWWGCGCHGQPLPYPPLYTALGTNEIEVTYRDHDGNTQAIDQADIRADEDAFPGLVYLSSSIPSACCNQDGVIRWWAGVDTPQKVEPEAKAAIKLLVAHWYANREAVTMDGAGAVVPIAFDNLAASLSWSGAY